MSNSSGTRNEREARLRWVPVGKMKVSPLAQRELNQARVDHLTSCFDPEQMGTPTVSERDGHFWIIDGQHRVEAYKAWIGSGWREQQVQCWVYSGLSEEDEAETFLKLNDVLAVNAYSRFVIAVRAGRPVETDIDRIVRANGCVISLDQIPGAIAAVGTLVRVYNRAGGTVLGRTLRLDTAAYGDPGLTAPVIDGLGHLCQRYNGDLNDEMAVKKLGGALGGVNGLLGKAEVLRKQTGRTKAHCVAAAAVEIINSGKGGNKLPSWWKQ